MGPRIIASSFLTILRIDDAWQTPAKGSHEVSSVGQQLVQDQVLGEVAIAARPFSLLGALLMGGDCDLRQRRSIDLNHRTSQAVRHLEKRFGPLAAKALTSENSVSSPRPKERVSLCLHSWACRTVRTKEPD